MKLKFKSQALLLQKVMIFLADNQVSWSTTFIQVRIKAMKPNPHHLIWIDLEMTGLDPDHDSIIEIATVITDGHLNIIEEGPVLAIHQKPEILEKMDEWNVKHHTRSGLIERVQSSLVDEKKAEAQTLEFIMQLVPPKKSPMCGNSVCQDRRFLFRHMPSLEKYFHYRNLDVSTVKELAKRWVPNIAKQFKKKSKHIALEDIKESIEELRYYHRTFFRLVDESSD